jgi:hypothetical protein
MAGPQFHAQWWCSLITDLDQSNANCRFRIRMHAGACMSRRDFLRTLGKTGGASAVLATFPPAIQKALALPANVRTRSLQDVELSSC